MKGCEWQVKIQMIMLTCKILLEELGGGGGGGGAQRWKESQYKRNVGL